VYLTHILKFMLSNKYTFWMSILFTNTFILFCWDRHIQAYLLHIMIFIMWTTNVFKNYRFSFNWVNTMIIRIYFSDLEQIVGDFLLVTLNSHVVSTFITAQCYLLVTEHRRISFCLLFYTILKYLLWFSTVIQMEWLIFRCDLLTFK